MIINIVIINKTQLHIKMHMGHVRTHVRSLDVHGARACVRSYALGFVHAHVRRSLLNSYPFECHHPGTSQAGQTLMLGPEMLIKEPDL